jgi:hypothetical protein
VQVSADQCRSVQISADQCQTHSHHLTSPPPHLHRISTASPPHLHCISPLLAGDPRDQLFPFWQVTHVINYSLGQSVEQYVHRIGRCGRAGASGLAHTFLIDGDERLLPDLIALLDRNKQPIPAELTRTCSGPQTRSSEPDPPNQIPVIAIPVKSDPVMSIPVMSNPVMSNPVKSIPVMSNPVMSVPGMSIPVIDPLLPLPCRRPLAAAPVPPLPCRRFLEPPKISPKPSPSPIAPVTMQQRAD